MYNIFVPPYTFYPRDAMPAQYLCLSVCLSVSLSQVGVLSVRAAQIELVLCSGTLSETLALKISPIIATCVDVIRQNWTLSAIKGDVELS